MSLFEKLAVLVIPVVVNLSCMSRYASKCELEPIASGGGTFHACKDDIDDRLIKEFGLVAEVKGFGQRIMGMAETDNYREYRSGKGNNGIEWLYSLYITPKDVISAHADYRYLDNDSEVRDNLDKPTYLVSKKDNLRDEYGFYENSKDVYYRMIADYVHGKEGCDMTPKFINEPLPRKIEVILHEDWHVNHAIQAGQPVDHDVSESVASFVGFYGAAEFAKEKYGEESWIYGQAVRNCYAWADRASMINAVYKSLSGIYSRDIPFEHKMDLKRKVFDDAGIPSYNNASIAYDYSYVKYLNEIFRLYRSKDRDFARTVELLRKVPAAEADAEKFFRDNY